MGGDGRPDVRVNQVGYLCAGPKHAVWVSQAPEPSPFRVIDGDGTPLFVGISQPWPRKVDVSSGMSVHVVDFSDLTAAASGCAVEIGGTRSRTFEISDDLYRSLADDALAFFYLQRSGVEIDEARAPGYGRPAGHPGDVAVGAWTGPDAQRLYPGWSCRGEFDVSGGWYDAGDHGKYVTSGAMPVWQLMSTVELLRRRGDGSPWSHRLEARLLDECRWQLDWLLRMQVPAGLQHAGLAFHRVHGTRWAPLPCWPHRDPTVRVLHRPSTAAGLHLAAAAAHGARLFASDRAYSHRLLDAAVRAFRAALAEPNLLAPDDAGAHGGGPYGSDDVSHDVAWAAAELYLATGNAGYAQHANLLVEPRAFDLDGFDFNRMAAPGAIDLALHGQGLVHHARAVQNTVTAAENLLGLQADQPWGQPYAPSTGWDWGSNGRILNNLVVLAVAHQLTGAARFLHGAARGIDHLLGVNALGQSYVTGHGTDVSHHQRARHFAHDLDPAFPPPPPGALAGGPTSKEHPGWPTDPRLVGRPAQCRYLDEPTSETTNDICIRWNAPLVFVATYLTQRPTLTTHGSAGQDG